MHFLTSTALASLLSAVSLAAPTVISTSIDGFKYTTADLVHSEDIVTDGVTKTVQFFGFTEASAVDKRQFYIGGNQNQHFDKCGASTFVSLTSQFSPTVADCRCIVDGVNRQGGYWYARPVDGLKVSSQIIKCESCAFTIKSDNEYGSQVGDTDIR